MKTINLLPKTRQEELRYETVLHSLFVVIAMSLASFVLVFVAQFITRFYLELQANSIKASVAELKAEVNKQQNSDIKIQIQTVNNLISDYKMLANDTPKWSKVIKAFAKLPPGGLKINTFNINPQSKTISITGISPTRELVIQLYYNILHDPDEFSNVDYPLENVATPKNVNFHYTFSIQPKLLEP